MRRTRRPRPDLLTTGEAARLLGCSREWVIHAVWMGLLTPERVDRQYWFTMRILEEFAVRRRRRGRPPKVTSFD